jgi:hypothetical protein
MPLHRLFLHDPNDWPKKGFWLKHRGRVHGLGKNMRSNPIYFIQPCSLQHVLHMEDFQSLLLDYRFHESCIPPNCGSFISSFASMLVERLLV